jgi:hypothetical protein
LLCTREVTAGDLKPAKLGCRESYDIVKFFTGFSRENAYYKNHLQHLKLTGSHGFFAIINSKNEMVLKLRKTAIAESLNLPLNFDTTNDLVNPKRKFRQMVRPPDGQALECDFR